MREISEDIGLIGHCGLYCGACKAYLKEKCSGCRENEKASWCRVRSCCTERSISTCAQCNEYPDPNDCNKFNNFISRVFGFIFRSDRAACIHKIRESGPVGYAKTMTDQGLHSFRR